MEHERIDHFAEHVRGLLGEKLRVTGRTLETRVRRAGRGLPRPVRNAAQDLVSAQLMSQEPKMRFKIDPSHASNAYTVCLEHLESIDEKSNRSKARFSLAATAIVQISLVTAVLLTVLRMRGFV